MLNEYYAGKTILLTGSTGFLGKVVLEKILRSLPSVKTIYLSIKPRGHGANAEYARFQKEIVESKIFDRLKTELGIKNFKKIIKDKIRTLPMDLMYDNLGLTADQRQALTQDLNIIISNAATLDFMTPLDVAT